MKEYNPSTDQRIVGPAAPVPPQHPYIVHFIYLVPSDKQALGYAAIYRAARHLQSWYQDQMATLSSTPGKAKTFALHPRVVMPYFRNVPSSWYANHDSGGDQRGWFWQNVLYDLSDACGGGFYMPYDDWVVYVDAEPNPGQYAGGASTGTCGVCVLGAKDIAALQGIDPDWSQCRGIGGGGHELGHTFNLPHPPAGPDFARAIMGTGYTTYPNCVLLDQDKRTLNANPFFYNQNKIYPPSGLCPFGHQPTTTNT